MIAIDAPPLVIFGASNMLSDLFDCALANGLRPSRIVLHLPEPDGPRDKPLAERLAALAPLCPPPAVEHLDDFLPRPGERYILGPTTPTRAVLAEEIECRFGLAYCTLVHPTAYVSPLATLGQGCFVGANSVIAPGVALDEHVFVNRGATIGHDTRIGPFSRVQPGAHMGSLSVVGRGVTIGIGATVMERLVIGEGAVIGAGSVVTRDVPAGMVVVGTPAKVTREA